MKKLQPLCATVPDNFGSGGANLSPQGQGSPSLVSVLQEFNGQISPQVVPPTVTTGAIDPDVAATRITVDSTQAYTLADGTTEGQRIMLSVLAATSTPDGTLTPVTFADGTSIDLDAVGESVTLEWHASGGWHVVMLAGATLTP